MGMRRQPLAKGSGHLERGEKGLDGWVTREG